MTDTQMDATLVELETAVKSVTTNLRFTPGGLRDAIASVRAISRLSFDLTHEVISRVRKLESK